MTDALEPLKGLFHRVRGSVSRRRLADGSGLRIVREPQDADIDIVAVHGLGGEGFRSWVTQDPRSSNGRPRSWLEDLLGQDVPNARILTYGYATDGITNYRYLVRNVLYGRALDLVQELAVQRSKDGTSKRPIFFIAHSLGGWIVKRGLIISKEASELPLRDVELSTCGVAFFGTLSPGRPSSPSPLANVIRRTSFPVSEDARIRTKSFQSASSIIPQQQQDVSDETWLENQMEAFKGITANLPRLSFYETKQSGDSFVVEKRHSMVGSNGMQVPLTSTHAELVKFRGRADANYKQFLSKFREMMDLSRISGLLEEKRKEYELSAVHRPDYLNSDFSLPYQLPSEPSLVVPRRDLMTRLDAILQPSEDTEHLHVRIANCWGPAGSGKTTLAKHYAELHSEEVSFVLWIWAESWESVVTSYLQFASGLVTHYSARAPRADVENHLGLRGVDEMLKSRSILQLDILRVKSVVQAVKDWLLRPKNDKWLLIFDHLEPTFDIFDFIPLTRSGRIILTARDGECCSWGSRLEVGPMTEEESLNLLAAALGRDFHSDPMEADAARKIVQHLNYLPSSISLKASTIRRKGTSLTDYVNAFELQIALNPASMPVDQSPLAEMILNISAMLSPSAIPVALFSSPVSRTRAVPSRYKNAYDNLRALREYGVLDTALQHLFDHNYIQSPSPTTDSAPSSQSLSQSTTESFSSSVDSFILDPAARSWVRESLGEDRLAEFAYLACTLCVESIRRRDLESSSLPEIHVFARVLGPHACACFEDWGYLLQRWPQDNDIDWYVLGRVCMTQGAVEQAIGCFELSLEQKDMMDPVERIQVVLWLASILRKNGQPEKSRQVLDGIDARFIDQAAGFRVAKAKASAAAAEGQLARAEDGLEMLEQQQAEALGVANISTVDTVQQLAGTLEQTGKTEEAQALYRRVWLSCQSLFGPNHPTTLAALEDLARISLDSHAIDEAEALYRQAVEINMRTLGEDHPSTAQAVLKLALIDDIRCRYEAARLNYERALNTLGASGKANPSYTAAAENFALSSRWHGHSLVEDADGDITMRPPSSSSSSSSPSSSASDHNTIRATTVAATASMPPPPKPATTTTVKTDRPNPLLTAERLYLEVLSIKSSARDLYAEADITETASKLGEMYESESFFDSVREVKGKELRAKLREVVRGRRTGTDGGRRMIRGMSSSLSEKSVENWR